MNLQSKAMVLNWGNFSLKEHWAESRGTVGCHKWGMLLASSGRGQGAAKHPAVHRTAPPQQNYVVRNVRCVKSEKHGSNGNPCMAQKGT